jgi:predicted esterase
MKELAPAIERARRKVPISIWIGTRDDFFPLRAVRATRDALKAHGFDVTLTEIAGHDGEDGQINGRVWDFLRKHRLEDDPKYHSNNIR